MKQVFSAGEHLIQTPIRTDHLVIEQGAVLKAPEGSFLTFTVNGRGRPTCPGEYRGEIALTTAPLKIETTYPSVRRRAPIPLKAAVILDGEQSRVCAPELVQGGTVTDTEVRDVFVATRDEDYGAIVADGAGNYTISRAVIHMDGAGTNDFVGKGAGVAAIGGANVTIQDSEFYLTSVTRCAVHVGGTSTVTVNNSKMINLSPQVEMGAWSWGIQIRGTNRLNQLADDGTVSYNGCLMRTNGWGILSVDGSNYAHMFVKDCDMALDGTDAHGYGVFCIGPTDIHLDHTKLNVNGFPVLLLGMERKGVVEILNGTEITGRRFGLHCQSDLGSKITIRDSSIRTEKACLLVKGAVGSQYFLERAALEAGDGNLLQLIDKDDPGMGGKFVDVSMYDKPDRPIPGRNLTEFDPENDVTLHITDCSLKGDFLNSTTDLVNDARKEPPKELILRGTKAPGELGNEGKLRMAPPEGGNAPGQGMPPGVPAGGPPMMQRQSPTNLAIYLDHTSVQGRISAATQKYADGLSFIDETTREELSHVFQTPAPAVNNGVLLKMGCGSRWTVTGESYLTRLEIEPSAVLETVDGGPVTLSVDGQTCPCVPGVYTGSITVTPDKG